MFGSWLHENDYIVESNGLLCYNLLMKEKEVSPTKHQWFNKKAIHELEKENFSSFFNSSSILKKPEVISNI